MKIIYTPFRHPGPFGPEIDGLVAAVRERFRDGVNLPWLEAAPANVRPYELAREADRENNEVVAKLQTAGIPVRNYMTVIVPEDVARARAVLGLPAEPPPTPAPALRMPIRRGTVDPA